MENLIISTLGQGLLWSLLAIGVFITFRVLDIADLTVEGSFPLGAAISVTLVVAGVNPVVSILAAAVGGMLAGVVTGLVHTKLKIPALLAGILTMIALYSVNLHVMGKANVSLLRMDTVYTYLEAMNISATWLGHRRLIGSFFIRSIFILVLRDGNRGRHSCHRRESANDSCPGREYGYDDCIGLAFI